MRRIHLVQAALAGTMLVLLLDTLSRDETAAVPDRGRDSRSEAPRGQPLRQPLPEAKAARSSAPLARAPARPASRALSGRVLDLSGRPLAGVALFLDPGRRGPPALDETDFTRLERLWVRLGKADRQGRFRVDCPVADGVIRVGPRYVTVRTWRVLRRKEAVEEALIVAAKAVQVQGRVVDRGGNGLAEVSIAAWCPTLSGFPEVLDGTQRLVAGRGTSNTAGQFQMQRLPASEALELVFSRPGYRTLRLRVPPLERTRLYVVLERPERREGFTIGGRVFDPEGRPAAGAMVGLAGAMTRSDDQGSYKLEVEQLRPEAILFAGKEGYRSAVVRDIAMELAGLEGRTLARDLFLGSRTLSIQGRVVDAAGQALVGHIVYLLDPRFLDGDTLSAEGLAAGVERDPYSVRCRTDREGRFELRGLELRSYRLRVLREAPPLAMDTEPIPAGSRTVVISVPERALQRGLAGRVVGHDAVPLQGARVRFSVAIRGDQGCGSFVSSQPVTTDVRGAFRLERVPARGAWLTLGGDGIEPQTVDIPPPGSPPLWIVAARRCHFRVEAPRAPPGTSVRMLDGAGQELLIRRFEADGHARGNRWMLEDGQSEVLAVSERATTVVFELGGKELERQPLFLAAGRVNVVEWR